MWAWGENRHGDTGNGSVGVLVTNPFKVSDPMTEPARVLIGPNRPLTQVIAIAASGAHSLALRDDGTVWSWGYNGSGQRGDGSYFEGVRRRDRRSGPRELHCVTRARPEGRLISLHSSHRRSLASFSRRLPRVRLGRKCFDGRGAPSSREPSGPKGRNSPLDSTRASIYTTFQVSRQR